MTIHEEWLLCPICSSKTRTKIRVDTILVNFPLFCPRCKKETIINAEQLNMSAPGIKELIPHNSKLKPSDNENTQR